MSLRGVLKQLLILALFGAACEQAPQKAPAPAADYAKPPPADYTGQSQGKALPPIQFSEIAAAAGLDFNHQNGASGDKWMPETMGSGCALFDYDGDGDLDALLVNSSYWPAKGGDGRPTSKLFGNRGDGTFEDVTAAAGLDFSFYGMGVAVADYDADGDQDVYLTALGDNVLLRNEGGRFVDVAQGAGVKGSEWEDEAGRRQKEWSTAALWADVDGDGWLDLLVANYVRWSPDHDIFTSLDGTNKSYATPQQYPGSSCRLYRNQGDGTFVEVTAAAGLDLPEAKSMGAAMEDFDGDGAIDMVITNDTQPNYLLHNRGDGTFVELGLAAGIGYDASGRARAGMGVDVFSLENDGVLAIGIGNFSREALSLYQQRGQVFIDVAGKSRLVESTLPTLTFGLRFFDADLDGYQDLVLANGHLEPEINTVQQDIQYAQAPQLFWNDGQGRLRDISQRAGPAFSQPLVGRGLAVGDVDGDGDLDVLLSENGGPARLLRNEGPTGNGVALRLKGTAPNLDALGTVVVARSDGLRQRQMVRSGSSYLSHSAPVLTFGLGAGTQIDRLEIRWADGTEEAIEGLAAGKCHWIEQGRGVVRSQGFGG